MIQQDRPECRGTDPVQGEASDRQLEVAGPEDQGHRNRDQIARAREVDAVLNPDPPGRGGNQAKDNNR